MSLETDLVTFPSGISEPRGSSWGLPCQVGRQDDVRKLTVRGQLLDDNIH